MSVAGLGVPPALSKGDAIGYLTLDKVDENSNKGEKAERRYQIMTNVMNVLSVVLSPIVGLVRMAVNAYFLAKGKDAGGMDFTKEEKGFLKAQIARGAAEFFCLGIFIAMADAAKHFGVVDKAKGLFCKGSEAPKQQTGPSNSVELEDLPRDAQRV